MKRMKDKIIKGLNWRKESFDLCTIYNASAVHLINHKIEEKGSKPVFEQCRQLIEQAYQHYKAREEDEGWYALEEVRKLLRKVRTQ